MFEYGVGVTVPLVVTLPVMSCAVCGARWTDRRAERARTEAVLRYRHVFAGSSRMEPHFESDSPNTADTRAGNTSERAEFGVPIDAG